VRLWRGGEAGEGSDKQAAHQLAAFSPDGREIAFIDDRQLRVWTSTDVDGRIVARSARGNRDGPSVSHSPRRNRRPPAATSTTSLFPNGEIVVGFDDGTARSGARTIGPSATSSRS
jgi:hypothetical protein